MEVLIMGHDILMIVIGLVIGLIIGFFLARIFMQKYLKKWMITNEYIIVEPIDKTVMINLKNAEYFKPLVYREKIIEENLTKINEYVKEIQSLKIQNEQLNEKAKELTTELEGIKDSKTWKIMNPIRKIKNIINN